MLLPGKRAGLVRNEAARLFVRYYGGDLTMADGVISNRQRQDDLEIENPGAPGRLQQQTHTVTAGKRR